MTEKEKMISQKWFDNSDPWMVKQRQLAADTAIDYDRTREEDAETKNRLLKGLLGHIGENCSIAVGVKFDYGCNTYIGDDVVVNFNVVFLDCAEIHIGDRVLIGPNCSLLTPMHPLLPKERCHRKAEDGHKYLMILAKPIVLEDDVWLGGNVTIMPGVTVGRGSIIGAGSVVTKDIPPNSIAAGNPCRIIRKITPEDTMYKQ
ncbi:MAG: sugar O-acetyltransferase [Clostridia bacterium]|nr:sugar O-acetyltransferase [Clostridia bacterium]